jgi:PTS system nitrogen regulatory IIA component
MEIMTLEEVARYLRVSERVIYDWAQKGLLPGGKIGAAWRFRRADIDEWVSSKLNAPDQRGAPPSVSLADALDVQRCILLRNATKIEALNEMIDALATAPVVMDRQQVAAAVFEREQLMSTGIGLGIGLPHVRLASVKAPVMALGVSRAPIDDYESLDGEPVRIIVMVAAARDQHPHYLRLLYRVSTQLKDEALRERLSQAASPERMFSIISGKE